MRNRKGDLLEVTKDDTSRDTWLLLNLIFNPLCNILCRYPLRTDFKVPYKSVMRTRHLQKNKCLEKVQRRAVVKEMEETVLRQKAGGK